MSRTVTCEYRTSFNGTQQIEYTVTRPFNQKQEERVQAGLGFVPAMTTTRADAVRRVGKQAVEAAEAQLS